MSPSGPRSCATWASNRSSRRHEIRLVPRCPRPQHPRQGRSHLRRGKADVPGARRIHRPACQCVARQGRQGGRPRGDPVAQHGRVRARLHGRDQGRRHFRAGQHASCAGRDRLHPVGLRAERRVLLRRDPRGARQGRRRCEGPRAHHCRHAARRGVHDRGADCGRRPRHARGAARVRRQHDRLYLRHHRQAQGRDPYPGELDHPQWLPQHGPVRGVGGRPPARDHAARAPHGLCAHGEHAVARFHVGGDAPVRPGAGRGPRAR